ncbi:MAG: hypothetical protein ACXABY_02990, partial [Candidatus Thorarchaeota archaeon]
MPKEGKPERGFLETAITAAPAGIGLGISARNMLRAGVPTVGGGPASESAIRAAISSATLPGVPDINSHLEYMSKQAGFFRGTGADVAREAWTQAMGFADAATSRELLDFTQNLRSMPAASVADAIEQTLRTNQSQAMARVFSRFRFNVNALTAHQNITGTIPKFAPFNFKGAGYLLGGGLEDIPEVLRGRLAGLGERGLIFQEAFGYKRAEFPGFTSFRATFQGPKGLNVSLLLPMVHEGAMLEGVSMRTRYIAPDVAVWQGGQLRRMTRPEYMLEQFERTIAPAIQRGDITTQAEVDRAMRAMRGETLHKLETISNVPAGMSAAEADALRRMQEIKGRAVDIRVPAQLPELKGEWHWRSAFEIPTETEMAAAMRAGGFGGGVSPTAIAAGRVMGTTEMAQWAVTPEAADWSRRLEQAMREFTLTSGATAEAVASEHYMAAAALDVPGMKQAWRGETLPPQLRTMYVDPSKFGKEMQAIGLDEGEAIARNNVTGMLEQQGIRHQHLMVADEEAMKMINQGKELKPGRVLGWTTEGDPFVVGRGQRFLGRTIHESTSMGEFATLHYMETHKMGRWEKFFGDLKAVVSFRTGAEFQKATNRLTNERAIAHGFEVIASMDELKKNRALHNKQI